MRVSSSLPWAVFAATLLAPAVLPPSAQACSIAVRCSVPVRLFNRVDAIPGNLIYFKVTAAEPGTLTLRKSDGTVVPASIRTIGKDRVFAPLTDVAPNLKLTLEYTSICPPGSGLSPKLEKFEFNTTEAQELELPIWTLEIEEQGFSNVDHPESLSAFTRVRHDLSCVTCTGQHLEDSHIEVDGVSVSWADGILVQLVANCVGPEIQSVDMCGGVHSYARGPHTVEAWSTVVGATQDPPRLKRTVQLTCDPAALPHPGAADAGVRADAGVAAGIADAGRADAALGDVAPEAGTAVAIDGITYAADGTPSNLASVPDDSSDGCSLAGSRQRDPLGLLAVVLAMLAFRRARPAAPASAAARARSQSTRAAGRSLA